MSLNELILFIRMTNSAVFKGISSSAHSAAQSGLYCLQAYRVTVVGFVKPV